MTTRFLIVPVAAIAFLLIGAPYAAAVAQSPRSALMPETIAACREQALGARVARTSWLLTHMKRHSFNFLKLHCRRSLMNVHQKSAYWRVR